MAGAIAEANFSDDVRLCLVATAVRRRSRVVDRIEHVVSAAADAAAAYSQRTSRREHGVREGAHRDRAREDRDGDEPVREGPFMLEPSRFPGGPTHFEIRA